MDPRPARFAASEADAPLTGALYAYGRYALADALRLSLPKGSGVLVPAYCCPALTRAIAEAGCDPVFFDVGPMLATTVAHVTRALTPAVRGIVPITYFGWETVDIAAIAAAFGDGRYVLVDAAHAVPLAGHDVSCDRVYSFRKTLGRADGAAWISARFATGAASPVPLPDQEIPAREDAVLSGLAALAGSPDRAAWENLTRERNEVRKARRFSWSLAHSTPEAVAAWRRADFAAIAKRRRRHARFYADALSRAPGIAAVFADVPVTSCPIGFPVWVSNAGRFTKAMWSAGVEVGYWWPELPAAAAPDAFPISRRAAACLILLPVHQDLGEDDLAYVARTAAAVAKTEGGRGS